MASKARKAKTFKPPKEGQGYFHRDHRVRRKSNYDRPFVKQVKEKLEKIKINEFLQDAKTLPHES